MAPTASIALHGAPDKDIASKDAKQPPLQAMQLELTHDLVDELLGSLRSGKPPQLFFGRTPQIKYGDKTHLLQTSPESYRHELYQSSGAGGDDDFEFAGLISHSLAVQRAEDVTAGVDTALEQLKSSMAAISEFKEANKTIVGTVGEGTPIRTPGHRRFPSKSFKPQQQHLAPSSHGSPMLSVPSSPMGKPPTSQPAGSHHVLLRALRVPLIHLLAVQCARDTSLAETCCVSPANVRDLLPKIAKPASDADHWQLTDKSFRELDPWKFAYKNPEDRERAINSAVKAFDRLRLAKDDKLWQILLPVEERGQGKCLSRLNVKAPDQKPPTPLHRMPKLNEKKPAAAKKAEDKEPDKDVKRSKEGKRPPEARVKKPVKVKVKEKAPAPTVTETTKPAKSKFNGTPTSTSASASASTSTPTSKSASAASRSTTLPNRNTPSNDAMRIRRVTMQVPKGGSAASAKPKLASRDHQQKERIARPAKPAMPINTKPKNPSPLSASPPVNASDLDHDHPVHKALAAAPSPAKPSSGNSDRSLKRRANDIDSDIHNHNRSGKQARADRPTPALTPSSSNSRATASTPASSSSLKRKSDDSSTSNTPTNKVRKVTSIDTGLASRYPGHNSNTSPGESSSSATSPALRLSFRQTVELSQKFQHCYKKYEELYWQLAEATTPPTEAQRSDLMKMHKNLEKMKREIKSGAGGR